MSLSAAIHESLPYIDPDPTPAQRAAAEALISAERALVPDDPSRLDSVLPPHQPSFTEGMAALMEAAGANAAAASAATEGGDGKKAKRKPALSAIDLSRYEVQEAPASSRPGPRGVSEDKAALRAALGRAYAASTFLTHRHAHLVLLEAHGRNAWLLGNYALEGLAAEVQREAAGERREVDLLALARRRAQGGGGEDGGEAGSGAGEELRALEEAWRSGVGRVLETEVAAVALERELQARR